MVCFQISIFFDVVCFLYSLLQLFVIGLQHFKISEDTSAKKKLLNLEEKTNLRKLLLQFLLDVVILPYR